MDSHLLYAGEPFYKSKSSPPSTTLRITDLTTTYPATICRPEQTLLRTISATLSGATFISGSIGVAWATICLFQRLFPAKFMPTSRFYLNGFVAGLMILLDRARALEIGLYGIRLSLVSAWAVAAKRGRVKSIRYVSD